MQVTKEFYGVQRSYFLLTPDADFARHLDFTIYVRFGSLADLSDDISLMSAFGGGADVQLP